MKRIALRWLGALLLSITLAAPALAAGKHLINGIDANYPPFAYVDETGKPAGFDVDSMNWIAKKMGFTVEHKPMDWDGIIPALLAKKIDMVCSGMSISPERKAQANFSDPYWTIRKIFITKKGSKVTEDQIYNGKIKLGVQRGTNEHEMLQKAQAEKKYNYQLRFYDSGPMAIEDLLNGRIDAIGLDAAPADDAMRKGKPVQEVGVFGSDEFGVAIRKDDAETMKPPSSSRPIPTGRNSRPSTSATSNDAHAGGRTAPGVFDALTQDRRRGLSPPSPPCCQDFPLREDWRMLERFSRSGRGLRHPPRPSGSGRASPSTGPAQSVFPLKGATLQNPFSRKTPFSAESTPCCGAPDMRSAFRHSHLGTL